MPFIRKDTNGCKQSTDLLMCPYVPLRKPITFNISIATAAKTCPIVCYSFSLTAERYGHSSALSRIHPTVP